MTEDDAAQLLCEYLETLFPKACPTCQRMFRTLREYIENTQRVGPPVSYDADADNWDAGEPPLGTVALVNCPCGSTMALSTDDMPLQRHRELLQWAKEELNRSGLSPSELVDHLRDKIRERALR